MPNIPIILILVFFALAFLIAVGVFMVHSRRKKMDVKDVRYIKNHWERIVEEFNKDHTKTIIEADKLLDYALNRIGFKGNTGEKLKAAGPRFSNLNGIWSAHKLRNRIAHELKDIDKDEAKSALKQFRLALNDLGVEL